MVIPTCFLFTLACEEKVLDRLVAWSQVPHTSVTAVPLVDCKANSATISKTVRLHGAQLSEVAAQVEEVKVVHLVRDPRAVAASVQAQQEEWGGRTATTFCRQLLADLKVGEELGPDRYFRVTYEELVERPVEVLERISAFTGIPMSEQVLEAVAVRMLGKADGKRLAGGKIINDSSSSLQNKCQAGTKRQQRSPRSITRQCARLGTNMIGGEAG